MKKIAILAGISAAILFAASCHKNISQPQGTVYLDLPAQTAHYFKGTVRYGDTSYNQRATLGRVHFYDSHLSLNNTISCATCHKQTNAFSDNAALSTGFEGRLTKRNSKSIQNLGNVDGYFHEEMVKTGSQPLFWDGREVKLVNLVNRPITNHVEMGISDPNNIPAKLATLPYYASLFTKAYGDNTISSERISECIATFMTSITSANSKFDKFSKGRITYNALEEQGYNLFINKYGCGNCHHVFSTGYSFFDFKDIGLDEVYTDMGLGAVQNSTDKNGMFRVPNLVNVALTAPYMHDGRFKTLGDVIDHYSHGIKNSPNLDAQLKTADNKAMEMQISVEEKTALIAFLNTFTDYTTITDPKFSNPFKVKNN